MLLSPTRSLFHLVKRTFDEVKHTYCRKAVYATSASLLMRRVTTTPFSSHW